MRLNSCGATQRSFRRATSRLFSVVRAPPAPRAKALVFLVSKRKPSQNIQATCLLKGDRMKNTGMLIVAVTVALVISSLSSRADAQTAMAFEGAGTASCTTTPIDVNEDGVGAFFCPFEQGSTFGPLNGEVVLEYAPLAEAVSCPAGNLELTLVAGSGFKRHQGSGDLIFLQYTSGTNCVDPVTGIADLAQMADITGGTGRFANATGSFEETSEGTILLADPALRSFIYFPYQIDGTITLANGGDEGSCSLNILGLPCP